METVSLEQALRLFAKHAIACADEIAEPRLRAAREQEAARIEIETEVENVLAYFARTTRSA